jgi:hypothetical protein
MLILMEHTGGLVHSLSLALLHYYTSFHSVPNFNTSKSIHFQCCCMQSSEHEVSELWNEMLQIQSNKNGEQLCKTPSYIALFLYTFFPASVLKIYDYVDKINI